jgi:catechol 2,3-dioxygenase-like lactoylglutathione lyase family enzyme
MDWKLEVVVVPVSDVDRSKAFYSEKVGFHVDVDDAPAEGFRIVQMTPPGSACSVTIGKGLIDSTPGSLNVEAARQHLVDHGVEVTPVRHFESGQWRDGHGGPWNSFIFFDDPDGNSWTVQEKPASA